MSGKGIDNSASQVPGNDGRYVIVITRWNEDIVNGLYHGAIGAFAAAGIEGEQVEVVSVPGAFEIPLACQAAAQRSDCDAVVALGAVIRGGTPHFEYVAGECTTGCTRGAPGGNTLTPNSPVPPDVYLLNAKQ